MSKNSKKENKTAGKNQGMKLVCENRKAKFLYHLHERFEAGMVLTGSEVKSLRHGTINLTDAYADIRDDEAYLLQAHISPYDKGGYANHEPKRKRKLLLHRTEIQKLMSKTQAKGMSLVPTKIYFKNGKAKVEIALATGKKMHDKRDTVKTREQNREMERAIKRR